MVWATAKGKLLIIGDFIGNFHFSSPINIKKLNLTLTPSPFIGFTYTSRIIRHLDHEFFLVSAVCILMLRERESI